MTDSAGDSTTEGAAVALRAAVPSATRFAQCLWRPMWRLARYLSTPATCHNHRCRSAIPLVVELLPGRLGGAGMERRALAAEFASC